MWRVKQVKDEMISKRRLSQKDPSVKLSYIIPDQKVIKDWSDRNTTRGTWTRVLLHYCKSLLGGGATKNMEDNHLDEWEELGLSVRIQLYDIICQTAFIKGSLKRLTKTLGGRYWRVCHGAPSLRTCASLELPQRSCASDAPPWTARIL